MRETRDYHFLTPLCLPIEPLGGLFSDWNDDIFRCTPTPKKAPPSYATKSSTHRLWRIGPEWTNQAPSMCSPSSPIRRWISNRAGTILTSKNHPFQQHVLYCLVFKNRPIVLKTMLYSSQRINLASPSLPKKTRISRASLTHQWLIGYPKTKRKREKNPKVRKFRLDSFC